MKGTDSSIAQGSSAPKSNCPEWVRPGAVVDYCSMIGGPVTDAGMIVHGEPFQTNGMWVVFLEWKSGYVAVEALRQGNALSDVRAERRRQDKQWGGPEHDDTHAAEDWIGFIQKQLDEADGLIGMAEDDALCPEEGANVAFRARLVKVAALAVAAIETLDRAARVRA